MEKEKEHESKRDFLSSNIELIIVLFMLFCVYIHMDTRFFQENFDYTKLGRKIANDLHITCYSHLVFSVTKNKQMNLSFST